MVAVVFLGRQAGALRVYYDLRRRLGEELGIGPSRALAAQHAELLVGATAESERPAGRTMPGRLPVPLTAIVGRGTLATELTDLASTQRLVTLVGPGGVGKTRLLLEVGHRLQADRDRTSPRLNSSTQCAS